MNTPERNKDNGDLSALHEALVDKLQSEGHICTSRVEAAFRAIPRHLFLPGVSLSRAYSDEAIATKVPDGQAISSSSQPAIMAIMLEQLGLEPGHRVLEIGAGTGYNAALMAHMVGDAGPDETLAHRLLDQVVGWNAAGRPSLEGLRLRSYPPDRDYAPSASELAIQKQWSRLVLDWR